MVSFYAMRVSCQSSSVLYAQSNGGVTNAFVALTCDRISGDEAHLYCRTSVVKSRFHGDICLAKTNFFAYLFLNTGMCIVVAFPISFVRKLSPSL